MGFFKYWHFNLKMYYLESPLIRKLVNVFLYLISPFKFQKLIFFYKCLYLLFILNIIIFILNPKIEINFKYFPNSPIYNLLFIYVSLFFSSKVTEIFTQYIQSSITKIEKYSKFLLTFFIHFTFLYFFKIGILIYSIFYFIYPTFFTNFIINAPTFSINYHNFFEFYNLKSIFFYFSQILENFFFFRFQIFADTSPFKINYDFLSYYFNTSVFCGAAFFFGLSGFAFGFYQYYQKFEYFDLVEDYKKRLFQVEQSRNEFIATKVKFENELLRAKIEICTRPTIPTEKVLELAKKVNLTKAIKDLKTDPVILIDQIAALRKLIQLNEDEYKLDLKVLQIENSDLKDEIKDLKAATNSIIDNNFKLMAEMEKMTKTVQKMDYDLVPSNIIDAEVINETFYNEKACQTDFEFPKTSTDFEFPKTPINLKNPSIPKPKIPITKKVETGIEGVWDVDEDLISQLEQHRATMAKKANYDTGMEQNLNSQKEEVSETESNASPDSTEYEPWYIRPNFDTARLNVFFSNLEFQAAKKLAKDPNAAVKQDPTVASPDFFKGYDKYFFLKQLFKEVADEIRYSNVENLKLIPTAFEDHPTIYQTFTRTSDYFLRNSFKSVYADFSTVFSAFSLPVCCTLTTAADKVTSKANRIGFQEPEISTTFYHQINELGTIDSIFRQIVDGLAKMRVLGTNEAANNCEDFNTFLFLMNNLYSLSAVEDMSFVIQQLATSAALINSITQVIVSQEGFTKEDLASGAYQKHKFSHIAYLIDKYNTRFQHHNHYKSTLFQAQHDTFFDGSNSTVYRILHGTILPNYLNDMDVFFYLIKNAKFDPAGKSFTDQYIKKMICFYCSQNKIIEDLVENRNVKISHNQEIVNRLKMNYSISGRIAHAEKLSKLKPNYYMNYTSTINQPLVD